MAKKPGKDLRVGNPERERAIALLGEHLTAGRLDVHDYDQRSFTVAAASFDSQVRAVFEDLPEPHPERQSAPPAAVRSGPDAGQVVTVLCAVAVLLFLVVVVRQIWLLALVAVVAVLWFARRRG